MVPFSCRRGMATVLELLWLPLVTLLLLPTTLLAQSQNASSFYISMQPSPLDLMVGFNFQLHEGMATCFRSDANGVFTAIPQVRNAFYQRCGGVNFTATQVNTVVTGNSTTMESTAAHAIYIEVLLVDPSQYTGNLSEMLTNTSLLRATAARHTNWVDGPPPTDVAGSRWEDVRRFYYAKQFSGPFAATNALQPASRFLSSTGFSDALLIPTGDAIPMQLVGFLPVVETIAGPTECNVSSVVVDSGTFYFASTPHNLSGVDDFATELQVEILPRVAMRVNYSGTLYRFGTASDPSAVGVAFDIADAPRSPLDERKMFRTDADWDPASAPIMGRGNVKVVPPLMSVGVQSLRAVQWETGQFAGSSWHGNASNASWWASPSVPSVSLRSVTLNTDFPLRTRSMRCFGAAWAPVYAQQARLNAMYLPSMAANGTLLTTSTGTYIGDHPCIPARAGEPGSSNASWFVVELCPNLATRLMRGYHLCAVAANDAVPQAFSFLPVLAPTDVSASISAAAAAGGDMLNASAASMQMNTTQAIAAFAEAADGNGVIGSGTAAIVNASLLFRPSSTMRVVPVDRSVNITVRSCFLPTALLVVPLVNNSVPSTTLRPLGTATPLSVFHVVDALHTAYRVMSITSTVSILLQADPDNGYCGVQWREGLVAQLWAAGLVVGFHNIPFRTRSTAYVTTSVNVTLGTSPRCCTTDYGASVQTTCMTRTTTTTTRSCTVAPCTTSVEQTLISRNSTLEDRVSKQSNVTIAAVALRCSYDVYNLRRNCTAAVGAFVQLVLLPSTWIGDAYLANHTLLHQYADDNPGSVSLTGLPLQLTNASGVALFAAAGPSLCFADTVRLAAVFPIRGASDGTSVISDGAVTSYYRGITSYEYASSLYLRVRPTPGLCGAGVRTIFVGGILGAPLGALDTDIQDSCGTLLSGLVSMRLVSSSSTGSAQSTASTVSLSQAPLSTTLGGVLERQTNQLVSDASQWRATFVGVVPTGNSSRLVSPAVKLSMRMRSASLAAIGDVVLSSDVQTIPFLANLLLNTCAMSAAASSWVVARNVTADALAPLLPADCGSARLDLMLMNPVGHPIVIEVDLFTSPSLLTTIDFAVNGAWLNITFTINCLNTAIATATSFADYISFSSNLDQRRAPRAFLYAVHEGAITFHNVEIREHAVADEMSPLSSAQVSTVAYVLPIFVEPRALFNNLVEEVVTVHWSPELFVASSTSDRVLPSTAFVFSQSSLTFAIYPNARSSTSEAVMWLNFLTMSGNVVRVGNIVVLRAALSKCYTDSGDRLDLALHPLSFGVGSDDTTQYLVGGVVGNVAVIVAAFVAHAIKEHVIFRGNTEFNRKGAIDIEDPDASKGLRTFPSWGLVMCVMLYPGLMYSGVRAVSLGLNTVLLYSIMLMLVLFGIGFLALLVVAQRYYTPRWQDNEAFNNKDVTQSVAAGGGTRSTRRSAKARLDAARESAKTAVADTQHAVGGFFSKTLTPTGFYEVNHTDHIRFLVAFQDYRGKASYAVALDASFGLLYAIASAFDCPTNQTAALIAAGGHVLFLLAYRPYVTVARVLCNVMIDVGCLVAIAITSRGREREGIQTLDAVMMAMSGFNFLGFVWSIWRSEGLRRIVRHRRRLSRKSDHFAGRGKHYQSSWTGFLKAVERHLYGLHSVKPQVVHRRMVRKRRLLNEDANVVIESSSGSPTDDDSRSSETPNLSSFAAAMAAAAAASQSLPGVTIREASPSDEKELQTIRSNDGAASSVSFQGLPPILNLHGSIAMSQRSHGVSPLGSPTNKRTTSTLFRSTVSDDDDDGDNGQAHEVSIHADSPDAMNSASVARRKFAANRFKAYIKTETGKSFGRSDADSVVKRLVVTEDGVREVREWREGTVQMANEEIRRRQSMEDEFKNLSSTIHRQTRPSTSRWSRRADRDGVETEGQLRRWEDAFRYEIARAHGIDTVRADSGSAGHETLLQRRQRVMGAHTPAAFDFDRGVDGS